MKRSLFVVIGAIIALQPVQASAQVVFNGTPNDVEWLNFLSGSGQGGTYHVQVGAYSGQFLGSGAVPAADAGSVLRSVTTSPFSLYCVDYYHYASASNGLSNITSLAGGVGSFDATGSRNTRLADYGAYQKSAYYASLFDSWEDYATILSAENGGSSFSKANVWGGMHAAIWNIATGPTNIADFGPTTHFAHFDGQTEKAIDYFLGLNVPDNFSTNDWYVVTRTTVDPSVTTPYNSTGQEFLMRVASVPEPGTALLMMTGLFLMVGVNRKRLIGLGTEV